MTPEPVTLGRFLEELAERPQADPHAVSLKLGLDPTDPDVRRFLAGAVQYGLDTANGGLTPEVARCVTYLEESRSAQARMKIARRVGIPYSQVVAQWSPEDLAMEIAQDVLEAVDDWERCSHCGVAEWEVWEDGVRWLPNGKWKIVEEGCKWCREIAVVNEGITEQAKKDGVRAATKPRRPGDEMIETSSRPNVG